MTMRFIEKISRTLLGLVTLISAPDQSAADSVQRPNIVLIVADDMGYADMEPHGSTDIHTPQLTRLAEAGVTLTSGYVSHSFCGPSRAGLITGRYQQRFGHENNPELDYHNDGLGLNLEETTIARRLQDAGYFTGGVGKWHLGAASAYYPLNRGFDYFYGFLGGGHDYFEVDMSAPIGSGTKHGLVRNRQPASFSGYLTDALSNDATAFITRRSNQPAPFFLYLAYNAPHSPLQATADDLQRHRHIEKGKRRTYAAMVHAMDRGIGKVLDALEAAGQTDKTLVIFFSDNGGPQPVSWSKWFDNGSSNLPLRGGKATVYEGGLRVPFIMSWPGTLPTGIRYDRPVNTLDAVRTAVEAGGANALSKNPMEGVDLVPLLTDPAHPRDPHEAIFWRQRGGERWAIRAGDHKLIRSARTGPEELELYDLSCDVGEAHNLVATHPEIVQRLHRLYNAWDAKNIPPAFLNAPDYRKVRDAFYENVNTP